MNMSLRRSTLVTWLEVVVIVVLLSNLLMGYSVVKHYTAHPTLASCHTCNCSQQCQLQRYSREDSRTIFVVTATYTRYTQQVDLTTLCHTLMLVPNVVWIVIEDSKSRTSSVTRLLERCRVKSVHLNATTPKETPKTHRKRKPVKFKLRGVAQRNAGLQWLRDHHSNSSGVVYFADDDNKYDLKLFEEIRQTYNVSVFKVAFVGDLKYEGPICTGGRVDSWHTAWPRAIPIDMAGFAISLRLLLEKPDVLFGQNVHGQMSKTGYLESDFLEHFATRNSVECMGSETEVYVWHTHTSEPDLTNEKEMLSNNSVQL